MRPHSRGRLTLTSPDPRAPPRIELNFLTEPEDLRRLVAGMRLAIELARSSQLAPYVERVAAPTADELASTAALKVYVRRGVVTYHHSRAGLARAKSRG